MESWKNSLKITSLSLSRKDQTPKAILISSTIDKIPFKEIEKHLHPYEKKKIKNISLFEGKKKFMASRFICKIALQNMEPKIKMKKTAIKNGIFTYPIIHTCLNNPYEVSITHTKSHICALVFQSGHPMGIDLEEKKQKEKIYKRILTKNELDLIKQQKEETEVVMANILWSIKEAVSKTLRCGFTTPYKIWEVSKMKKKENKYESFFTNFFQLKAYSFNFDENVLSICLPKKTNLINKNLELFFT